LRQAKENPVPALARQPQPEAFPAEPAPARPSGEVSPFSPNREHPLATAWYSPALALQDELHERLLAERDLADFPPYPVPVRIALVLIGALASWAAVFGLARLALAAF